MQRSVGFNESFVDMHSYESTAMVLILESTLQKFLDRQAFMNLESLINFEAFMNLET